jgi:hypothetical protein
MYIGLTSISIGSFISVLFRFFYSLPSLTRSTSVREFFTFSHSSKSHLHALLHKFFNPYVLFLLMSYSTWNAFWEWRGEILLTKRKYRTIATWALGNAWKCQWNWNVPVTSGWNNSLVWVSEWVSGVVTTGCHDYRFEIETVLCEYALRPKKVFIFEIECVLCEVGNEAEETFEHRAYNTT